MRKLILAAAVLGIAVSAYGAVGDYEAFVAARDWSNMEGDDPSWDPYQGYMNTGAKYSHRTYKMNWQEAYTADWDTQAILDWMGTYAAGTTFKFELFLHRDASWESGWPPGVFDLSMRYEVNTLNLLYDWAEGDGIAEYNPFNWTKSMAAATNWYAQTWYTDGDGLPGSYDETPDYVNSVQWTAEDGTPVDQFRGSRSSLFLYVNGVYDQDQSGSIDPGEDSPIYWEVPDPGIATGYESCELQYDPDYPGAGPHPPLVNDLLYNEYNRGIIMGPSEYYDDFEGQWIAYNGFNGKISDTAKENATQNPYIRVEVLTEAEMPIVGDTQPDGCVDGLDYGNWSLHYLETGHAAWSAGGYTVGNFNEDDIVDGLDYGNWSLHYLEGCSAPGAEVPEPAVLSLLAVASLALIRRKRR